MAVVELKPVNGWSVVESKYPNYVGKYRDAEGFGLSGWFTREYKHTKQMIALNNGHVMVSYRFPRVDIPFSSLMHRWENLWFCGDYFIGGPDGERLCSEDRLLQAVLDGFKPIGYIICFNKQTAKSYLHQAISAGKSAVINDIGEGWLYEVAVSQPGTIGELIDIDAVFKSYVQMDCGSILRHAQRRGKSLYDLQNKPLADFLTNWDYVHPRDEFDCILSGLLLGFPIESTVVFMRNTRRIGM